MTYTRERIEAVAPNGVMRFPNGEWKVRLTQGPMIAGIEWLSPDAIVDALNESLVECETCGGWAYLKEPHGEKHPCPDCTDGKRDPHADLRALIERLEREKVGG